MQLFRVKVDWSGSAVKGSACNVLHFDGSNQTSPPVAGILLAYQHMNNLIPAGVTFTVPNQGDIIEDTTGELVGVWSASGGGTFTGPSTQTVAAGVGACVSWYTGGIVQGKKGPRKLRGRTFLAPLASGCFDTDGTLGTSVLQTLQTFGTELRAAGPLAVWHRPNKALGLPGNSYAVLSHVVRDRVAYLSSRRD